MSNAVIEAQVKSAFKNMSGPGFLPNPDFLYFDGLSQTAIEGLGAAHPYKALSAAERNRLVRAAKSPTPKELEFKSSFNPLTFEPIVEIQAFKDPEEKRRARQFTVIQERKWAGEIRVRTRTETPFALPPEQWGDRISEMLSNRGARAIADSAHFMATQKGGYKTFITGTFKTEDRNKIKRKLVRPLWCVQEFGITASIATGSRIEEPHSPVRFADGVYSPVEFYWESGIQAEVTRSMDTINKMYQRGFYKDDKTFVPSSAPVVGRKVGKVKMGRQGPYTPINYVRESLCYCWVAEVPKNEAGEDNPHVHILMNWRVPKKHFVDWSKRLEAIWNNGTYHLEKIKTPAHAGAYIAKAAKYFTKGNDDNSQGEIRGNRYSISAPARAPAWCTMGEYEMGVMGRLIAEIEEHMTSKHGKIYAERKNLNAKLEATPKDKKKQRQKIGRQLSAVRAKVNALPVRASKYQLVIKGQQFLNKFLGWAAGQGWNPDKRPSSQWAEEFNKRQYVRRKKREHRKRLSWVHGMWESFRGIYDGESQQVKEHAGVDWFGYEQLAA